MKIIKSINKLNKQVNFKANIGFVPTMGALHKGHLSLIDSCKRKCDKTLVSIFVNPSQFNKKNDYKRYPRNLAKDIKVLKKRKVDYLFIPKKNHIYKKKSNMKIKINSKDKIMCAKFRKGHFEGVLAVINQFLKIIKAKYMFLGKKDYQQAILIKNFVKNKFLTKIVICQTIRDKNSLAYSSRNLLLNKNDLLKASKVPSTIKNLYNQIKRKFYHSKKLINIKKQFFNDGINIEYIEIRNKYDLSKKFNRKNFKIFVAFYIKNIRLIDNF